VEDSVKAERAYLSELGGGMTVRGMGSSSAAGPDPAKLQESLERSFKRIGLSESTAKVAATGRN
ncbi:MAG: hypothetical protein ACRD1T_13275, partial [Acidimicrobiia bacterium]